MALATVTDQITSLFRSNTINSGLISVELHNRGAVALNAFQIKLYSEVASDGLVWFESTNDFIGLPEGSPMKGLNKSVDPTTLAAGASVGFVLADEEGTLKAFSSIEFLASVASGETDVEIFIHREND